ncbi:serine O-acetyltransferase EpsC [Streptomyces antibioticus]|uniref:serine O-acetyltransferase EpsC n=1 Tax=Streptomyces antibioticus TaxID=1890 RepID=UPI003688FB04
MRRPTTRRRHRPTAPRWYLAAVADLDTIRSRDPSVLSRGEALLHPALPAVWGYRVAHRLHRRGLRRLARLLSNAARVASGGVEIHPGARIGRGFFIDHGAGTVIGETAVIGDDVTLFHQVTLGSTGWWHDRSGPAGGRRHPVIGDRVVIGAGAAVLGPVTVGSDTVIGAHALVLRDVPEDSRVLAPVATPRRTGGRRSATRRAAAVRPAPARSPAGAPPRTTATVTAFPTW